MQPVDTGLELGQENPGPALLVVHEAPAQHLVAVLPLAKHLLGGDVGLPPRPQPISRGGVVLLLLGSSRDRLLRGQQGLLRLLEGSQTPGGLTRSGHAIQIGAYGCELDPVARTEEGGLALHRRLDGHKAESEGSRGGTGLTPFIGDVGMEAIAVGHPLARLALVGAGDKETLNRPSASSDVLPAATISLCADGAPYHQYHQRG